MNLGITITRHPASGGVGVFRVDGPGTQAHYLLRKIPNQFGKAGYEVRRLADPECFNVLVVGPNTSTCDCLRFYSAGMCRHLMAVLWIAEGWLVEVQPEEFDRGDDEV